MTMTRQISPPLPDGMRACSSACYLYHSRHCEYNAFLGLGKSEPVVPKHSCLHSEVHNDFIYPRYLNESLPVTEVDELRCPSELDIFTGLSPEPQRRA